MPERFPLQLEGFDQPITFATAEERDHAEELWLRFRRETSPIPGLDVIKWLNARRVSKGSRSRG
jgi:hypothetical protein